MSDPLVGNLQPDRPWQLARGWIEGVGGEPETWPGYWESSPFANLRRVVATEELKLKNWIVRTIVRHEHDNGADFFHLPKIADLADRAMRHTGAMN